MAYTLQQIYAALAAVQNGPDMMMDLQNEISNLRTEAATHRSAKQKVLSALGIADGADVDQAVAGIKTTLETLKASGKKPDEMGAQFTQLSAEVKRLSDELKAEKDGRQAEREKRIGATKLNKALAALQAGNAINPETLSGIIVPNIIVKDDDTMAYKDGEKEVSIEDGIKAFLAANPWAVKNTQKPGSGSNPPANGGQITKYSKQQIESMTPDEINKNWESVQASLQEI